MFAERNIKFINIDDFGTIELLEGRADDGVLGKASEIRIVAPAGKNGISFAEYLGYQLRDSKYENGNEVNLFSRFDGKDNIELIFPHNRGSKEYEFLAKNGPVLSAFSYQTKDVSLLN